MTKTLCAILLVLGSLAARAERWAVSEASLRFDYTVESAPSEASAGILVFVPDGGLLPTPQPKPVVVDGAGKLVEAEVLWWNPQEGLGLVIAKPPTPGFSVYVGRQSRMSRNDKSAFTPGTLFYVKTGNASLDMANRLAGGFPPGQDAVMGPVALIGQQENPFGPDFDFSGWFRGYLKISKPGRYYFATISDEGSVVKIGGKTVAEWPGLHTRQAGAKGQFGSAIDLTAGVHPVEYFYFNQGGPSEAQLVWRQPGDSADLPTLVPASAYVRSGRSKLTGIADREGLPVALPAAPVESYLWFGDQPDNLHRLACLFSETHPKGTTYEWKMDDGSVVREPAFPWLFEGGASRAVTLTVRSGPRSSTASVSIRQPSTPSAANVNAAAHCQAYRAALLARCKAVPTPGRPAADWRPGLWQLLPNVVEPFKGQALLDELFERSREDLVRQLLPADLALVEDVFIENLRYSDAKRAASWLERLEKEEKDLDRKRAWTLARVELALYQAGDTNLARRTATALASQAAGSEAGVLALVRLGDIEALAGRFDAARAQYAQAQAQTPRKAAGAMGSGAAPALARSKAELEERKQAPAKKEPLRRVDPWKAEAVRGGVYYETIRDRIRTGNLREARQELRNWELELPTEKLGGEYPVAEAEYFMAVRDYPRVCLILSTYRQAVDVSPFMPRALGMEMECLLKLGKDAEAAALADLALKRFPGLPVADQARILRETSGKVRPAAPPAVEVK